MPPPSTKLFHSAPKEVDFPPALPLRKNADMRTYSHKLKGKIMFKKTGALGLQRQTVEFKREIKILSLRSAPGRKSSSPGLVKSLQRSFQELPEALLFQDIK